MVRPPLLEMVEGMVVALWVQSSLSAFINLPIRGKKGWVWMKVDKSFPKISPLDCEIHI